jgi:hypothetical protein
VSGRRAGGHTPESRSGVAVRPDARGRRFRGPAEP